MTDDELLYAANETIEQLKSYEAELTDRYSGHLVRGYGTKVFRVDGVEYQHGELHLVGFLLKADGTRSVRRYAVEITYAQFVESAAPSVTLAGKDGSAAS